MAYKMTRFTIGICAVLLAGGVIFSCKKTPQQALAADSNQTEPNAAVKPKPTIKDIIKRSKGLWGPAFTNWYGKEAPDFNVTDLKGQKHSLSQYRGKNVMLVFWATWCPPCIKEIPHIIELRKTYGEDKLAILGVTFIDSRNSLEKVKRFVAQNPEINYTIIPADYENTPRPYTEIQGIPCSFFIDPEGKIKLVTEGMIPLSQMKAIVEAEK